MTRLHLYRYWLVLFVSTVLSGIGSAQDLSSIVASFYPPSLDSRVRPGMFGNRTSCFAVAVQANGAPSIVVAAFTNGVRGAVRVLQADNLGQFTLASEVAGLSFSGTTCSVTAIDLNGDGVNEVVVSFSSPRGNSMDWIFGLSRTSLVNFSPTATVNGAITMTLMDIGIVDLYHDGTLQIIDTAQYPPPADPSLVLPDALYTVSKVGLTIGAPVFLNAQVVRTTGPPQSQIFNFVVPPSTNPPATLRITNGDPGGQNRVSSANISLNGVSVAGPSNFNKNVEFLNIPIGAQLQLQNVLTVIIQSAPGSKLLLVVQ